MSCNTQPVTSALKLSAKGTGIYSIDGKFGAIVSVSSKCGPITEYEILNNSSIRLSCDLPDVCCRAQMTYFPAEAICGQSTTCNC